MKGTRDMQAEPLENSQSTGSLADGPLYRDPARAQATADVIMARIRLMDTPRPVHAGLRSRRFRVYRVALGLAAVMVVALVSSLVTLGWLKGNETVSVRFVLSAPEAESVTLVADFNDWSPDGHRLTRNEASGEWEILVPLRKGRSYVYNFLIDGEQWLPDPSAAGHIDDGLGGQASYISL
ncbi:MAG: isoamylase early set domain-containing protein [Spirochaetia bacterium]|nr:isoamylase early set domain-containing protein [Spirochaetia bacterium]